MAVVADRDAGYEGTVNTAEWARLVSAGMGARFTVLEHAGATAGAVPAESSLAVTQGTGDRGLRVEAGRAVGDGVLSEFDTATALQGTAVASGSRWDTVVVRRDWQTSTTTLMVLDGGTTKALSTNVASDRGSTVSDQPLALVRFAATSTVVQEVVDLRVWVGAGGGLLATSMDALQFLGDVGTHVTVGRETWVRGLDEVGSPQWQNLDVTPDVMVPITNSQWDAQSSLIVKQRGGTAHLSGELHYEPGTIPASVTGSLFSVPAGLRPSSQRFFPVISYVNGATVPSHATASIEIASNGAGRLYVTEPTSYVLVACSWAIG